MEVVTSCVTENIRSLLRSFHSNVVSTHRGIESNGLQLFVLSGIFRKKSLAAVRYIVMAQCTAAFRRRIGYPARSGFNLIELVIVIVIIGTVTAIAIPRVTAAGDKTKAHALAATLRNTQAALDLYKEEHDGVSAAHTPSGTVVSNVALLNRLLQRTDAEGVLYANGVFGPYLHKAPINPFATSTEIRISSAQTLANASFRYDPDTFILYPDNAAWPGDSEEVYQTLRMPKTMAAPSAAAIAEEE